MNIGFDLDKVLIDYPPLVPPQLIDWMYKRKSKGKLLYRIPSKTEQLLRLLTHTGILRRPIKKNMQFVKKLTSLNTHKYYLISSRYRFLKIKTEQLVKKHNLYSMFHELFFNYENKQPHLFKNEIIQQLKIDRYVDDDLLLLEFLAFENPKNLFFWLNKNIEKKMTKNLFAITDLSQMKI